MPSTKMKTAPQPKTKAKMVKSASFERKRHHAPRKGEKDDNYPREGWQKIYDENVEAFDEHSKELLEHLEDAKQAATDMRYVREDAEVSRLDDLIMAHHYARFITEQLDDIVRHHWKI